MKKSFVFAVLMLLVLLAMPAAAELPGELLPIDGTVTIGNLELAVPAGYHAETVLSGEMYNTHFYRLPSGESIQLRVCWVTDRGPRISPSALNHYYLGHTIFATEDVPVAEHSINGVPVYVAYTDSIDYRQKVENEEVHLQFAGDLSLIVHDQNDAAYSAAEFYEFGVERESKAMAFVDSGRGLVCITAKGPVEELELCTSYVKTMLSGLAVRPSASPEESVPLTGTPAIAGLVDFCGLQLAIPAGADAATTVESPYVQTRYYPLSDHSQLCLNAIRINKSTVGVDTLFNMLFGENDGKVMLSDTLNGRTMYYADTEEISSVFGSMSMAAAFVELENDIVEIVVDGPENTRALCSEYVKTVLSSVVNIPAPTATPAPAMATHAPAMATPVPATATPNNGRQAIPGVQDAYKQETRKSAASSYLPSYSSNYSGAMVIDGDETTCWQFSTKHADLGKVTLEITMAPGSTVDELWIKNGFWLIRDGLDQYTRNGRPREIGVSFRYDGQTAYKDEIRTILRDDKERIDWQIVPLGRHENVSAVKLRIISIYKGTRYKTDVALSEVMLVEREGRTYVAYETLRHGSKGDAVIAMKERLQELGYFKKNAAISGSYNETCVDRVKQFQKRNGLPQTGVADQATLSLLYSDAAKPAR